MTTYVREKGDTWWHWCKNCTDYPKEENIGEKRPPLTLLHPDPPSSRPPFYLCTECRAKEEARARRKQFTSHQPGVMILGSYYQPKQQIEQLKAKISNRFTGSNRQYFAGVIFVDFYVEVSRKESLSYSTPKIGIDLVRNPHYYGQVRLGSQDVQDNLPKITRVLPLIHQSKLSLRTVISSQSSTVPPYFVGKGNVNLICGKCKSTLGKDVWKLSLNNIILHCPKCDKYNEIMKFDYSKHQGFVATLGTEPGGLNFANPVNLRIGQIMVGI